jgi:Flp pilus assembly protein CpaB
MTVQATEAKQKKGLLSGLLGGTKSIWALAIVFALIAVFGALTIIGNAAATQTYYVLGGNVASRTQITPEMLIPLEAKVNAAPPTSYTPADVVTGEVFSKYALAAGDVITPSNSGPLTRITEDVPDNFVAASFSAEPDIAVAGKVRAGDFIDLIATGDNGNRGVFSKVMLRHVLVLDVTVAPSSIAEEATSGQEGEEVTTPGPESEAVRSGIPSVYTVAVSPKDATKLALIRSMELFVVLSGNVPDDGVAPETNFLNVFNEAVNDSSTGTFGSIFIKRWNVAFTPGNVYIDDTGAFWKVNEAGAWASGDKVLDANDLPAGYLPIPSGSEFVDSNNLYWLAVVDPQSGNAVWTSPENKSVLAAGDNPEGYDPNLEFDKALTNENAAN